MGKRKDKALVLTDAGRILLPAIEQSFDNIESVVHSVMAQGAGDVLTVATAPIFARSWLMPKLHKFVNAYPDINIRVNSTLTPTDSNFGEFDVGLMYGRGAWPRLISEMLFPETMVPVCSPSLLRDDLPLNGPEDLMNYSLIHSEARLISWSMWLENTGVKGFNPAKGLHF